MRTVHFKPDLCAVTNSRDPIELKNSIVLVEGNSEFLIGDDAKDYGGSGQRLIGGSIQDKHYQRYIQALLAKALAQVTTPSQSACRQQQTTSTSFAQIRAATY